MDCKFEFTSQKWYKTQTFSTIFANFRESWDIFLFCSRNWIWTFFEGIWEGSQNALGHSMLFMLLLFLFSLYMDAFIRKRFYWIISIGNFQHSNKCIKKRRWLHYCYFKILNFALMIFARQHWTDSILISLVCIDFDLYYTLNVL